MWSQQVAAMSRGRTCSHFLLRPPFAMACHAFFYQTPHKTAAVDYYSQGPKTPQAVCGTESKCSQCLFIFLLFRPLKKDWNAAQTELYLAADGWQAIEIFKQNGKTRRSCSQKRQANRCNVTLQGRHRRLAFGVPLPQHSESSGGFGQLQTVVTKNYLYEIEIDFNA